MNNHDELKLWALLVMISLVTIVWVGVATGSWLPGIICFGSVFLFCLVYRAVCWLIDEICY